jgi:hypothetical protein
MEAIILDLTEKITATEVKLMLRPKKALEKGFTLSPALIELFDISPDATERPVWYVDTADQKLKGWGWSVRFRQHKDELELTYKKRYTEPGYKAMLETPLSDAFDRAFEPEIDLGYSKKTISFSYIHKLKADDQPDALESRRLALLHCPKLLTNWKGANKGFAQLCQAELYGPVAAINYQGSLDDLKIKVEVWKLKSYIVELSFDIGSDQGAERKKQVVRLLLSSDMLEPVNTLKTDALFDQYASSNPKKTSKEN